MDVRHRVSSENYSLNLFYRIITSCHPSNPICPSNVVPPRTSMLSCWSITAKNKPNSFDKFEQYYSLFFGLVAEECKAAQFRTGHLIRPSNWKRIKVVDVVAQSQDEYTGCVGNKFPQFSSIDSVVGIPSTMLSRNTSICSVCVELMGNNALEDVPVAGDLVVIYHAHWERTGLGIVQGWEHCSDSSNKTSDKNYVEVHKAEDNSTSPNAIYIVMCVDCTFGNNGMCGGWIPGGISKGVASAGYCHVGSVSMSIAVVGNVTSYIREIVALDTAKQFSPHLKSLLLQSQITEKSSGSDNSRNTRLHANPSSHVALETDSTIPLPMWNKLTSIFNRSQLMAIQAVCRVNVEVPSAAVIPCVSSKAPVQSSKRTASAASKVPGVIPTQIHLLQGPPGTGKTNTILGIVSVFLAGCIPKSDAAKKKQSSKISIGGSLKATIASPAETTSSSKMIPPMRILVCAPSNAAIDEIIYRLKEKNSIVNADGTFKKELKVVRIGFIGGICRGFRKTFGQEGHGQSRHQNRRMDKQEGYKSDSGSVTLDKCCLEYLVDELRKEFQESSTEYLRMGRHGGLGMQKGYTNLELRQQILERAEVICCTLSGSGSQPLLELLPKIPGFCFDGIIIDEACQASEPSALIPFRYSPLVMVMVGDPCQLPATVLSRVAQNANYERSLFQRLAACGLPLHLLDTQYRMHPLIAEYPNKRFYNGMLLNYCDEIGGKGREGKRKRGADNALYYQPYHDDDTGLFCPVVFHDLPFSVESSPSLLDAEYSYRNNAEVKYIVFLFRSLLARYDRLSFNIGIIAPYRAQRNALQTAFGEVSGHCNSRDSYFTFNKGDTSVEISTVDGFQGREKDIIIYSCVRAAPNSGGRSSDNMQGNTSSNIGFLADWQRLNVAITRSKNALWIVGNAKTLEFNNLWRNLIFYMKEKGYFLSANQNYGNSVTHSCSSDDMTNVIPVTATITKARMQPTCVKCGKNRCRCKFRKPDAASFSVESGGEGCYNCGMSHPGHKCDFKQNDRLGSINFAARKKYLDGKLKDGEVSDGHGKAGDGIAHVSPVTDLAESDINMGIDFDLLSELYDKSLEAQGDKNNQQYGGSASVVQPPPPLVESPVLVCDNSTTSTKHSVTLAVSNRPKYVYKNPPPSP